MARRETEEAKRLRGTFRQDRATAAAGSSPAGDPPKMPRGMGQDKEAAKLWRLIVENMGPALSPVDAAALGLAARHYSIALAAYDQLQSEGLVTEDRAHGGDLRKSPAAQIWKDNSAAAVAILRQFGATPKDRATLPAETDEGETLFDYLQRTAAAMMTSSNPGTAPDERGYMPQSDNGRGNGAGGN